MAATSESLSAPAGLHRSRRTPLLFAALLVLAALPAQDPIRVLPAGIVSRPFPVTTGEIRVHLDQLTDAALGGREAGTRHEELAAEYVAAAFRATGLEPGGAEGGWTTPFRFRKFTRTGSGTTIRPATSRNVLGWLKGRGTGVSGERPYLLVGAHIDHLGVDSRGRRFPGADDNASGVAGMLAIAKALADTSPRPRHDVLFVGFGAEEQGLRGARHYVAQPARPLASLRAMINLDMIGRPRFLDREALWWPKFFLGISPGPGVGVLSGPKDGVLLDYARQACALDRLPLYAPSDFPFLEREIRRVSEGRADHAPFARRGIPHLFFSTSEHDDYHRPGDTRDKVDARIVRRISAVVTRTLLAIDAHEAEVPESDDG